MEEIIRIGRLRTTINGIAESINISADAPLDLTITGNDFRFSIPKATPTQSGYMSSVDKSKLDTISYNATDNIGTLTSLSINGEELSNSGPVNIPSASLTNYGVTKLSSDTQSDSEDTAATSKAIKAVWDMAELKTSNRGTITEIILNGESMGDYGSVDLGTVIREHQSIDHKVDKIEGKSLSTNDFTDEYLSLVESALQEHQDISHKVDVSLIGSPNGLATLDSEGKVPDSQLRSYYINVIEALTPSAFPETGEPSKIYVATGTGVLYRWNGTEYVELSKSLELGETSDTAYRGDRGRAAYNHSLIQDGNPHAVTKTQVGLGNVPNVTTNNQTVTFSISDDLVELESGEVMSTSFSKLAKAIQLLIANNDTLNSHVRDTSNPHQLSKDQLGLGNVQNIDQSQAISTLSTSREGIEYARLDGSHGVLRVSFSGGVNTSDIYEWDDGNPHNEDKSGYFVTLNGEKIKVIESEDEYVLGVVSEPDEDLLFAKVVILGKVQCVDDGTTEVNGFADITDLGIATACDVPTRYRVIRRIDESHILILINPII